MATIYDQIGGGAAVDAAVDIFYDKVMADPVINHFFTNVSMEGQRAKQKKFFTILFKGQAENAGQYMRNAHKHLTLTEEHFMAVAGHLQATLEQLNVPEDIVNTIMGAAAGLMDDVLNR